MVPIDDIEAIKRRNEERQRRLQEELAKLKPTDVPPPQSAFSSAIDAALSSTPLDQLTPDFGVPVSSLDDTVVTAPATPTFDRPAPPTDFSFPSFETSEPLVSPTLPPEFGIPETPVFAEQSKTETPIPEPAAAAPSITTPMEEDFLSDLPSVWQTPGEPAAVSTIPPSTPHIAEPIAPAAEVIPPVVEISATAEEVTVAPEFKEFTSFEAEIKAPISEYGIPAFEKVEVAEVVITPPITERRLPEPVVPVEAEVPLAPVVPPMPAVELPRVIVALDQGKLRWGRVGIVSEEEAIEILERAIAAYRSLHPKK